MTTLFPRGYGGTPSYQFSSPDQFSARNYYGGYPKQGAFAPHYPPQPLYQPPLNNVGVYSSPLINQYREPGLGTQIINFFNDLDAQYRYEGYLRQQEKLRKQQARQQITQMPYTYPPLLPPAPPPIPVRPPVFMPPAAPLPSPLPPKYNFNTIYQYEKITQYVPFPVYIGPYGPVPSNIGAGGKLTQFLGPNVGYGAGGNLAQLPGANVGYSTGGNLSLPPKVRVIFIPAGQSYLQQPYTGSLAMPPFLYNRIAQPLCSFPLPPPLPQIASLPLTPAVQQMVMQRYSNPVAVLPFSSNCQMSPSMMPNYPIASLPQQQSLLPATGLQALPPAPQAYIPAPAFPAAAAAPLPLPPIAPIPQYSSLPQSYIPPPPPVPVPAVQSFQPTQQINIPPTVSFATPIAAFQSLENAAQPYIPLPPPPTTIPLSLPPSLPVLSSDTSANFSSSSQSSYSGYPSTCRACPPAPPPLNISVTGHCWVQHCCACHNVPTVNSNPNIRPNGGRITPLLRQPTVPQYVPEQINQQRNYHTNAPMIMRPWLRKTPPLPPGAVLISDQYIESKASRIRYGLPPRQPRTYQRSSHDKRRSTTVTSKTTSQTGSKSTRSVSREKTDSKHRSVSPVKISNINDHNTIQQQQKTTKSNSVVSTTSGSTSTSDLSAEYSKTVLPSPPPRLTYVPPQSINASRNVNLRYNYQPQELSNVYLLNRYLKSNSECSTLTSNNEGRSNNTSPSLVRRDLISSPSSISSSIKKERKIEKEDTDSSRPPSRPNKLKERLVIIREFKTNSPSTFSTISSNMEFNVVKTDDDTISTASTIKRTN